MMRRAEPERNWQKVAILVSNQIRRQRAAEFG
jgi:hypothetical protein